MYIFSSECCTCVNEHTISAVQDCYTYIVNQEIWHSVQRKITTPTEQNSAHGVCVDKFLCYIIHLTRQCPVCPLVCPSACLPVCPSVQSEFWTPAITERSQQQDCQSNYDILKHF